MLNKDEFVSPLLCKSYFSQVTARPKPIVAGVGYNIQPSPKTEQYFPRNSQFRSDFLI